jgi:hypothetical protein
MRLTRLFPALLLVAACAADGLDGDTSPIEGADAAPPDPPDAAVGSPDAAPDPATLCEGAEIELGAGVRAFQEVEDGDTLFLYRGPQGGYMVYLSVRAQGIDPQDANFCYVLHVVDTDREVGKKCWRVTLPNDLGDGRRERVGIWGEVSSQYWGWPSAIRGHTLRVDATLGDARGCHAADGWTVEISSDPPT